MGTESSHSFSPLLGSSQMESSVPSPLPIAPAVGAAEAMDALVWTPRAWQAPRTAAGETWDVPSVFAGLLCTARVRSQRKGVSS